MVQRDRTSLSAEIDALFCLGLEVGLDGKLVRFGGKAGRLLNDSTPQPGQWGGGCDTTILISVV